MTFFDILENMIRLQNVLIVWYAPVDAVMRGYSRSKKYFDWREKSRFHL
jgi:hypothetical protein